MRCASRGAIEFLPARGERPLSADMRARVGMRIRRRAGRLGPILATSLSAGALFGVVAALADVEPNSGIPSAEVIEAGKTYSGNLSSEDHVDTYYFYAEGGTALRFNVATSAEFCPKFEFSGGVTLEPGSEVGPTTSAVYTTKEGETKVYYFTVTGSCNAAYSFTIMASKAFPTDPHPWGNRAPAPEPNETPAQAKGPLLGGITYEGSASTVNDEDWFYLYEKPNRNLTISITTPEGGHGCEAMRGDDPQEMIKAYETVTAHFFSEGVFQTGAGGVRKRFIWMQCSQGESYLLHIRPADALAACPASGPGPACREARERRRSVSRRLEA